MVQLCVGPTTCSSRAPFRAAKAKTPCRQSHRTVAGPRRRNVTVYSADPKTEGPLKGEIIENPDSEAARKQAEIDRLRAAEKFMVVGNGEASCTGCGYEYKPERGDPEFPVAKGTTFEALPAEYICPICGAQKDKFEARVKVVAGFAENQQYGLGTNGMTGEQKQLLIWGTFGLFFLFFIAGYGLN